MIRLAAIACGMILAGCAPGGPPLPITLGTGAIRFEPITEGESLPIILGPQGGYHIWMAIRIEDASLTQVTVDLTGVFEATGERIGPAAHQTVVLDGVNGAGEAAGLRDFVELPSSVSGHRVVVRVDVIAPDGRRGTDSHVIVPQSM